MNLIESGQIRNGNKHFWHDIDLSVFLPGLVVDANMIWRWIDRIERALLEEMSKVARDLVTRVRSIQIE